MQVYDYDKRPTRKSTCGSLRESFTKEVGFARAIMRKGLSVPHYHKKLTEYYLVLQGTGTLRIKLKNGELKNINLKPGIIVKIEPGEIHQSKSNNRLVVEDVSTPAWTEKDEFTVDNSLF